MTGSPIALAPRYPELPGPPPDACARITPSVLNADLADLAGEVAKIPSAHAVHLDVMDNRFVPNLTFGLPVIDALRRRTSMPMDVHLMIADVDRWAPAYAEAGCESVTFHAESFAAPVRLARELHRLGSRAALALRPATAIETYADLLPEFDMILLMTVEPGFGGQRFLDSVLPKIRRTRQLVDAAGGQIWIQVDGGVSESTIERCVDAGADTFVAGSAVFNSTEPDMVVRALAERATQRIASSRLAIG